MKRFATIMLINAALLPFTACNKKTSEDIQPTTTFNAMAAAKGGSGGGGNNNNTAIIQVVIVSGAARIIATRTDSFFVAFSAPVPSTGYTLTCSSSDTAVHVPATVTVAPGATNKYVVFTTSAVTNTHNVTITVSVSGQSKTAAMKLFPLHATIPAPSLLSPGNNSGFGFHRQVIFDWSDLNDAYYYEIQVSATTAFTTLDFNSGPDVSTTVADYFNGSGTRYWRVRGVDGSNTGGTWSTVRSFMVRPQ